MPPVDPQTDDERRRLREAELRRATRLREREEIVAARSARRRSEMMRLWPTSSTNRAFWNADERRLPARHGPDIRVERPGWGVWQIPEDEVHALGPVEGKDVLELGCGAAQWSIGLARKGAHAVGLDLSERQLAHARKLMAEADVHFPLVESSAESTPFAKESFDVVFCDHGAIGFTDPYKTIPEAARVLRPGGLLAFSMMTPFADACWPGGNETPGSELSVDYFGMHRREGEDARSSSSSATATGSGCSTRPAWSSRT